MKSELVPMTDKLLTTAWFVQATSFIVLDTTITTITGIFLCGILLARLILVWREVFRGKKHDDDQG